MMDEGSPLRIVSYAPTTAAGVPPILARCIAAKTRHSCRCVWATNRSQRGIEFPSGIEWETRPDEAYDELSAADLVIVHNGLVDPRHEALLETKPVITMAHNYPWNVDPRFVEKGYPGVVVGQYQALMPAFRDWFAAPNPVPIWEDEYRPEPKPDVTTLSYTPSGPNEVWDPSHDRFWHSKGYSQTLDAMRWLKEKHGVRFEFTGERRAPLAESLAMKRRAHIVVDECVTGSYHRNSLEGLAAGCVVVNGVGLLPGVPEMLRYCAQFAPSVPFEFSNLLNIGSVLESLVRAGRERLEEAGQRNRAWMERYWDFEEQWRRYWAPVVRMALAARPS